MKVPNWWVGSGPVGGPSLPEKDDWLDRIAVRGLYRIILVSVLSITTISIVGALIRGGIFGDADTDVFSAGDEALSILGNVASAAVGGLVGWLTRAIVESRGGGFSAVETPPVDKSEPPANG